MTTLIKTGLVGRISGLSRGRSTLFLLVALLLIAVYWNMGERALSGWTTSQKVFAIVILGVSSYMAYSKREQLNRVGHVPNLPVGIILLMSGCFLLVAGEHSGTVTLVQVSFFLTILGVLLLVIGKEVTRILFLPSIYLIFAFPIPGMVMDRFSDSFQLASAAIAEMFLSILGYPVYRASQFILLPHIHLEVAKVCSGSHHIISLLGLALPIAFFTQKGVMRRVVVVVAGFFIGIFANGVRVSLIGVWTGYNDKLDIHGPFNTLLISTFVVGFGSVFLLLFSVFLRRFDAVSKVESRTSRLFSERVSDGKVGTIGTVVAITLLAVAAGHVNFLTPRPVNAASLIDLPLEINGWKAMEGTSLFRFEKEIADYEIYRSLGSSEDHRLALYIGFFSLQKDEKDLFHPQYSTGNLTSYKNAANRGLQPWMSSLRSTSEEGRFFKIYRYYMIDNIVTLSSLEAKIRIALNAVFRIRNNGAIAVVLTDSPRQSWESEVLGALRSGSTLK